jgi:hypothetical protein
MPNNGISAVNDISAPGVSDRVVWPGYLQKERTRVNSYAGSFFLGDPGDKIITGSRYIRIFTA